MIAAPLSASLPGLIEVAPVAPGKRRVAARASLTADLSVLPALATASATRRTASYVSAARPLGAVLYLAVKAATKERETGSVFSAEKWV